MSLQHSKLTAYMFWGGLTVGVLPAKRMASAAASRGAVAMCANLPIRPLQGRSEQQHRDQSAAARW
jgi:hypothetical protein